MANYNGCVRSETMQLNTWVQVITPDGTKKGDPPYKVIYMLHGTTGNSMDWVRYTRLPLYACEYNVVFVVPEIANTWCRNIPDRGNFYNYIVDELPDLIGGMFNISDRREDVAIMGNSSGAYSAMKCALSRPEQFGLCAAFSTAGVQMDEYLNLLRLQKPEDMENPHMRSVFGPNLEYTDEDVLLKLAKRASSNRQKPQIFMSIGKQDFLYDANEAFSQEMEHLSFDYTYEAWDGGHDWYFWDQSLNRVLQKYYQKHQ
ncbi:alpha/beta hydrolase [Paenibacillus puldeungensis]|uniref:Alpha/beta hydrolase n=1 Tax=Paenibacillus puldeungensis TaxID=696536 RepID=A0ABW3S4G7_9BACL